jgi:tetratricopeptide (TPR) repeat protein
MTADRQKLIRDAERLVGRGKLNAAIDAYLAVLDADPDDTTTLNRVGDLYARLQRLGEAIELFKRAAEHFSEEGFTVKAIAIYRKILRLDPLQLEASESLADLQSRQGLVQDARQQYLTVADGYQRRGDKASVTAVHRKLVELEPEDPAHRLHLAELLKEQGQVREAQDQYGAIGELLLEHGKVEDALRVCREAFELDHDSLNFVSSIVGELKRAGHEEEAESFVEFAAERNADAARILTAAPEPEPLIEEDLVPDQEVDEEVVEHDLAELEVAPAKVEGLVEVEEPAEADEEGDEDVSELELESEEDIEFELEDFEPEVVEVAAEEAEEAVPEPVTEVEGLRELLIEAEVLARYGLEDKATEKFEEVIGLAPAHLDSHLQLITLYLAHQKFDRVAELGEIVAGLAEDQRRQADWDNLEKQLVSADFGVEDGRITPPQIVVSGAEEATELDGATMAVSEDLSWLDEVPTAETTEEAESAAGVFESEAEFFDLASEIERELDQEEGLLDEDLVAAPEDQSLEEIVEGFKKGMAETLLAEDYDTHYNLGIAYREMGLIDEAISEFQLAAKDHRYLVDCCSLLASCFVDKGFPELAVKWYNEGLSSPIITEEETLGLVYELGALYMSIGETEEARLRFVEIYGVNSDYRDVGTKLAELDQA